jgi:D-3-phosphoglycerate dehydrogenase
MLRVRHRPGVSMPPLFLDCPPFLKGLYRQHLLGLVPDLDIHDGDAAPAAIPALARGRAIVIDDHAYLDRATLTACPDLRCIVFMGTGAASFIDLEAAAERGITVRTVKGYGDRSVAEHALALILAAARQVARMDGEIRRGEWATREGVELLGKTLGVVGTGGIGAELIRMGAALGMKVVAWNRSGVPAGLPCEAVPLDRLLEASHVVSLHLVLNDGTRGFLSAERIGRLREGAILVNTARAGLVDEAALLAALGTGAVGHAALDVFGEEPLPGDHPLTRLPNVTLTAHAGFMTTEASLNLFRMALEITKEERAKLA